MMGVLLAFRIARWFCWWIRSSASGVKEFNDWVSSGRKHKIVISNHTSFADTIWGLSYTSFSNAWVMRPIASKAILDIPLLGSIATAIGVFSISYRDPTREATSMAVDPQSAEELLFQVEKFVRAGGVAWWFPEGRMNLNNPRILNRFRASGFSICLNLEDTSVFAATHVGLGVCWPPREVFGGFPCHVTFKFAKICESTAELLRTCDSNLGQSKAIFLADHFQAAVQAQVNEMVGI